MTIEEQRYLEECKKLLNREQMDVVTMALDYGLQLPGIRKVVQSNKNAECMREIVFGMMEGITAEVLDFVCENEFNRYQTKEIVEGISNGLSFEQVKSYATIEMSANRMNKMRRQLEETVKGPSDQLKEDDSVREYMKGLMEIMENSIQQFRESNERFDVLSSLVKEHVVDEKNREIQDLYENLKYKDRSIQELQKKVAQKDKKIAELQSALAIKDQEMQQGKSYMPYADAMKTENRKEVPILELGAAKGQQTGKKRMLSWLSLHDKRLPKDVFTKIMEADLSTEQLEEVRLCIECGLTDQEIGRVIENTPTPERMRKMREILMLMKKRKEGV